MSSHLRFQSPLAATSAHTTAASYPHAVRQPPAKKQKMSITQTYRIAHSARGKLSSEAARGDHDLRLLVGHANLLDSLMLELQDAEREQERWFNSTVAASKAADAEPTEPRRVQWIDQVVRDIEEDEEDSDEESESEAEEESPLVLAIPPRRVRSPEPTISPIEEEDEEEEEADDDADNEELTLVRTHSRYEESPASPPQSPPELVHDGDDSDDELPPSPPAPAALQLLPSIMVRECSPLPQKPLVEEGDLLLEDDIFANNQVPLIAAQA